MFKSDTSFQGVSKLYMQNLNYYNVTGYNGLGPSLLRVWKNLGM